MRAYAGARGMTPQRLRPCMCDAAQAAKRFSTLRANPACGSLSWCPRSCLRRNRGAALTQTASLSRLPSHGAGPDACVAPGRCHALILCVRARLRAAAADLAPPGCRGAAARRHPDAVHITDAARCLCRWGVCPRWACPAATTLVSDGTRPAHRLRLPAVHAARPPPASALRPQRPPASCVRQVRCESKRPKGVGKKSRPENGRPRAARADERDDPKQIAQGLSQLPCTDGTLSAEKQRKACLLLSMRWCETRPAFPPRAVMRTNGARTDECMCGADYRLNGGDAPAEPTQPPDFVALRQPMCRKLGY